MAAKEMVLVRDKRPLLRKAKRNSFTAAKQDKFFAELAATCNVQAACRKARVSKPTVYRHRRMSASFRARWREAVREAYAALELVMLERAMNGTVKTVTGPDGAVEKRVHEYPNAVALTLLRMHRATVAEADQAEELEPEDVDEVRERLARRIARLRARLGSEAGAASGAGGGA